MSDNVQPPQKVMTEFKIDYHTRCDSTGKDTVYKVYLASPQKGRVIMAERKDAVSRAIGLRPEISVGRNRFRNSSDQTINV